MYFLYVWYFDFVTKNYKELNLNFLLVIIINLLYIFLKKKFISTLIFFGYYSKFYLFLIVPNLFKLVFRAVRLV